MRRVRCFLRPWVSVANCRSAVRCRNYSNFLCKNKYLAGRRGGVGLLSRGLHTSYIIQSSKPYNRGVVDETGDLYEPMPAEDLINDCEAIEVHKNWVECTGAVTGENPALGHPRIFINLDRPGSHPCDYCGLRYFQSADSSH
eukprot:TRINITY_DN22282_c0_g1_i1.p1 TRINITY_DN22282_c0_g1~~TRINITY_DN22282_c0_g1_i1.p1  ORF type:complete len:142 (-),score=0.16 TRINITY_DN22282_c0_g1_i1:26-451(-)